MNDSNTPAATSIRARVHPRALDRMHMFFNASVSTAFVELIANAPARRRHARRYRRENHSDRRKAHFEVTISDDGRGIADPAVLLSFGESGWNAKLARSEISRRHGPCCLLAKHGCTLSSRPKSPAAGHAPSWRVELEPEHFTGKAEAAVNPGRHPPRRRTAPASRSRSGGRLDALQRGGRARGPVRAAALTLTFDGDALRRRDFLENAIRIEQWEGPHAGASARPGSCPTPSRTSISTASP